MPHSPPPGISIRPAVRRDDRAIRALVFRERLNPLGLDWRNFLVAEDPERRIVGIGAVKRHGDGSRELASITTAPEMRECGVAGAIVRTILTRTPGPLYLTCRDTMKGFYERFGFRVIGIDRMPTYFRRVYRLFSFTKRFFHTENRLVVMRRNYV